MGNMDEIENNEKEREKNQAGKATEDDKGEKEEEEDRDEDEEVEINEVNNTAEDPEEDDIGGQENEDETKQLLDNASNLLTVDKVREVSYDVLARTRVLFNIFASIYGVNNVHYDTLKQSLNITTL